MIKDQINLLKNSLYNLGLSFSEQQKLFPEFVDIVDEVVDDFANSFQYLPYLMENKAIEYDTVRYIIKCKIQIDQIWNDEEKLTDESFASDKSWNLLRGYAKKALESF
ncbi:hypothetical protein [Bacteroides sp. 519]|uniref:hypothetical protein n=1 Tax=Bacteroides sp. 519 TaxID=2302937 RepID=UPI0013D4BE21|nr:hypothetical protein [Bacteroides sp. 519]NDV57675.1 hypothetical protein [Bacteroides sp. 519]